MRLRQFIVIILVLFDTEESIFSSCEGPIQLVLIGSEAVANVGDSDVISDGVADIVDDDDDGVGSVSECESCCITFVGIDNSADDVCERFLRGGL